MKLMKIEKNIIGPEAMIDFGKIIGRLAYPQLVIALNGDLGAGKTTLTKGIGQAIGVVDTINSPTFTIMKVYNANHQKIKKLYHLDVYRTMGSSSDFDLEEYFYLDGITVIEWAEIIEDLLPPDVININLSIVCDTERQLLITSSNQVFMNKLLNHLEKKE